MIGEIEPAATVCATDVEGDRGIDRVRGDEGVVVAGEELADDREDGADTGEDMDTGEDTDTGRDREPDGTGATAAADRIAAADRTVAVDRIAIVDGIAVAEDDDGAIGPAGAAPSDRHPVSPDQTSRPMTSRPVGIGARCRCRATGPGWHRLYSGGPIWSDGRVTSPRSESHAPHTSASLVARARAKDKVRDQLRAVAREHIAEHGAAALSLRAVARALGLSSSAIYRYVSSRDQLITWLIVESYESVAEIAERADRLQAGHGANAATRWLAIARDIRRWAHTHPHEFALIYGTPIPGYRAPADAGPTASRIWRVIAGVMESAVSSGVLHPPARPFNVQDLIDEHVLATVGRPAEPFSDYIVRSMGLFSSLIGAISAELFGHFHGLVTDLDRAFDLVVATGAQGVGLDLPVDYQDGELTLDVPVQLE